MAAADAGAAIVHIHVREPISGAPSMNIDYYREVVDTIRDRNEKLVINLTTGPGGRFVPSAEDPKVGGPGTTLLAPDKRVKHIALLRPDICTLDLNTMNFAGEVVINTPDNLRQMATIIRLAGAKPELELFDSGDIALMHDLIADGTLDTPPLISLVLGVKYGFQATPETVTYARNLLPPDAEFTAFGIGKSALQTVALSYLSGGHVRVGLEDSIYLKKGVLAPSNASLVEKARRIVDDLGGEIATANEARKIIGLPVR